MKMKNLILCSLLVSVISFGCSKERSCTETTTNTDGSVDTDVRVYDKITPMQKRDIENLGTYVDDNGRTRKTICK